MKPVTRLAVTIIATLILGATGAVSLEVDAPYMLCILPKSIIQPVVSTLAALPEDALWPAHAG